MFLNAYDEQIMGYNLISVDLSVLYLNVFLFGGGVREEMFKSSQG